MTILEPNQPWPQVCFRRWDYVYQGYRETLEDKSVIDLIIEVKRSYNRYPTILFAGPRATNKIRDLVARDNLLRVVAQDLSGNQTREFLGMELILTVDDGLWMA